MQDSPQHSGESADRHERIDRILADVLRRRSAGEALPDEAVLAAHPELMPQLADALRAMALVGAAVERGRAANDKPADAPTHAQTPASPDTEETVAQAAESFLNAQAIPGYQVLGELHRGGQGVVYQAIQRSTKRKVAIKVMREGPFAGPSDRARFEREVQILGQLQHPNIVTVHDSGSAAGCVYFVMDYISGQPLDEWTAAAPRSIDEILAIFTKICEAVNAAHLRGIIHRDLKPGNIRVDRSGQPHILDFGLAKVSAYDPIAGDGAPIMTMTGQFVGSLPWASPEQAEGVPSKIDVRTDVYALGVILYQMLTGRFPYEVIGNMRDVLDRILKAEPIRPSTIRVAAASRGGRINDEVETIVLKCLQKERERRYQTAGELARDIGRYLKGEAIEAKRDSAMYVLRKIARRYRLPFGVAAGFALLIVTSSAVSTVLWRRAAAAEAEQSRQRQLAQDERKRADDERDVAKAAEAKSRAVEEFMQRMLKAANAEVADRDLKVVDLLDFEATELPSAFLKQPEIEAAAQNTLGLCYQALGRFEQAEQLVRAALVTREQVLGRDAPDTIVSLFNSATLLRDRARFDEAESIMRDVLARATRVLGRHHPKTLIFMRNLAGLLRQQRKLDESEALFRECVAQIDLQSPDVDDGAVVTMNNYANLLIVRRKLAEAETVLNELSGAADRVLRERDPTRVQILNNRAGLFLRQGRLAASESELRRSTALAAQIYPEVHPDRLRAERELSHVLIELGKWDEAESILLGILALHKQQRRDEHPDALLIEVDLASIQIQQGRLDEAARRLGPLVERCRTLRGERNLVTLMAAFELANLYLAQNDLENAERVSRRTFELRRDESVYGPRHPETLRSLNQLGNILAAHGDWGQAETTLQEAAAIAEHDLPAQHYLAAVLRVDVGTCQMHQQYWAAAEQSLLAGQRVLTEVLGPQHPRTRVAIGTLVELYDDSGRPELAREWHEKLRFATSEPATSGSVHEAADQVSSP